MIKSFFLVAYRNLAKNKATTLLNVPGLSMGVTVCLVIAIWLQRMLEGRRWLFGFRDSIFDFSTFEIKMNMKLDKTT